MHFSSSTLFATHTKPTTQQPTRLAILASAAGAMLVLGSGCVSSRAPKPAPTPTPTCGSADSEIVARYRAWITEARVLHPYDDSERRMFEVMRCESGCTASAVNRAGPYRGLFQYSDATWHGAWNLYRNESVLDPKAQIFATALAWSKHMQRRWGSCYRRSR
jgi:hypothetical protein